MKIYAAAIYRGKDSSRPEDLGLETLGGYYALREVLLLRLSGRL